MKSLFILLIISFGLNIFTVYSQENWVCIDTSIGNFTACGFDGSGGTGHIDTRIYYDSNKISRIDENIFDVSIMCITKGDWHSIHYVTDSLHPKVRKKVEESETSIDTAEIQISFFTNNDTYMINSIYRHPKTISIEGLYKTVMTEPEPISQLKGFPLQKIYKVIFR